MSATFDSLFIAAAAKYASVAGMDVATLAALAKAHASVESAFDPNAYHYDANVKDASYGLMQIEGATARRFGFTAAPSGLYDPATSIDYGVRLIAENLAGADGNAPVAIAAYNEGLGRAQADLAAGRPWRTTDAHYVDKVKAAWGQYLADFQAPPAGGGPSPAAPNLTPRILAGITGVLLALVWWWRSRS